MSDELKSTSIKIEIEVSPGTSIPTIKLRGFDGRSGADIAVAMAALDYAKDKFKDDYRGLVEEGQ